MSRAQNSSSTPDSEIGLDATTSHAVRRRTSGSDAVSALLSSAGAANRREVEPAEAGFQACGPCLEIDIGGDDDFDAAGGRDAHRAGAARRERDRYRLAVQPERVGHRQDA